MEIEKPELLAPVGNKEHLYAAINNGADAVYLGLQAFNARIGADNFSMKELKEAVDFVHLQRKKVYITFNTLLNDLELPLVLDLVKQVYEIGVDALIVQDLGLIFAVRKLLPEMELHASTQMTAHNSLGVKFLQSLGLKRIILARENSLQEIKEIKNKTHADLECFVHGAICIAYSGQCTVSSLSFKRSGNRGRCAQNCRLNYNLVGNGKALKHGYLISAKDLNAVELIPELIKAGVNSLKIEGRKKSTEYVAITTAVYRKAIDSYFDSNIKVSEEDLKALKVAHVREFSSGHFKGQNNELVKEDFPGKQGLEIGKVLSQKDGVTKIKLVEELLAWETLAVKQGGERMEFKARELYKNNQEIDKAFAGSIVELHIKDKLLPGQIVFKIQSRKLTNFAYASITRVKKIPVKFLVTANNKEFKLKVFDKDTVVEIVSDFVPKKAVKGLDKKVLEEKISKTGNTLLELQEIEIKLEEELLLPFSKVNDLRRKAVNAFKEKKLEKFRKKIDEEIFAKEKEKLFKESEDKKFIELMEGIPGKQKFEICIGSKNQLQKTLELNPFSIVLPLHWSIEELVSIQELLNSKKITPIISTNAILKDSELDSTCKKLEELRCNGNIFVECNNLGLYKYLVDNGFPIIVGQNMNSFNSVAVNFFAENSMAVTLSRELNFKQIELLRKRTNAYIELALFDLPEIMLIESNILKQFNVPKKKAILIDRKNWKYLIKTDEFNRTQLFNPVYLNMIPELEKFQNFADILKVNVSDLSDNEAFKVLDSLKEKLSGKKAFISTAFTRGSYEKGV